MNRYTVAVLVRNQFGVLNRVTSMFRRRQFNISALSVSETESNAYYAELRLLGRYQVFCLRTWTASGRISLPSTRLDAMKPT